MATDKDVSANAQRQRIAAYLLEHPHSSTIELREECNSLYPPARINELRHKYGWIIDTVRKMAIDSKGREHPRAGFYLLKKIGLMP